MSTTLLKLGCALQHLCKGGEKGLTLTKEAWPLVSRGTWCCCWICCRSCCSQLPESCSPLFSAWLQFNTFHFRKEPHWTKANNIWIVWYWHPCRKVEGFKKNPQDDFTPENYCCPFTSASPSLALVPFALKLPKPANEKGFLGENNVVQFAGVFCSWTMDWGRILPGCRELWDKQMIWARVSACNMLWEIKKKPTGLPILTVSSAVRQHFCNALLLRKNWMARVKIEKCDAI